MKMLRTNTKCSTFLPKMLIDSPLITTEKHITKYSRDSTTSYSPYERIRTCINNTFDDIIYLPGCSVFTLHQGDELSYPQKECLWEDYAIELQPTEQYCSTYDLFFNKVGDDYHITTKYCKALQRSSDKDDMENALPPVFEQDCKEIYTMSSTLLNVTCPKLVDCFPLVDEPYSLMCSNFGNDLIAECPNTTVIW